MYRLLFKRIILPAGAASFSFSFFGQSPDEVPTTSFTRMMSEVVQPTEKKGKWSLKEIEEAFLIGKFKPPEDPRDVDPKIWVLLAIQKSPLTKLHKIEPGKTKFNDDDFDALLHRLDLDRVWDAAMNWYSINVCGEEDLSCQDSVFRTPGMQEKPSKIQKLTTLLHVLLYKTEFDSCRRLVHQGILQALLSIFRIYNENHKDLGIVVLKVLSEIAHDGKACAEAIVESDWYPILVDLLNDPPHPEEEILTQKIFINMLYSFGLEDYYLPQAIYELHRPSLETKPVLDIVFVHGLRGSVFRTWRQKDSPTMKTTRFWPRDWLQKDLNVPVRILGVDYSTRLLQFGQVMETVNDRSRKFRQSFNDAGIGSRPVVFVCHSMGGLLVKSMLVENEKLRRNTVGILFMATPHKGSPVASAFAHSMLRPSDDVKFLKVENELNQRLNSDFMKIVKSIPVIVSTVECHPTPIFGTKRYIVPPDSGYLGIGALYHIDECHHNVCKPENPQAPVYGVILNFVRDALKVIGVKPSKVD